MSKLVIVESPAKAKTIKKYLGSGYEVVASMGHIRDLPEKRLSVDIRHGFKPKYDIIKGKEELAEELKKRAEKSEEIFLATDPDREGEAISWHLAYLLDLPLDEKNRVTFNEITQTGVTNGMANPRCIDIDLVNAQQARRILDRLVGYKLSPFLAQKIRKGLSAGRVQSVAVRIIVDREEQIRAFKPEEYWTIDAKFIPKGERKAFPASLYDNIEGTLRIKDKNSSIKLDIRNEEKANQILAELENESFKVGKVKNGRRTRKPAPPFITSTLQQECSRKLGFQSKRTMRIAQELYEGVEIEGMGAVGLITYMRTDSLRLSDDALNGARDYIQQRWGDKYLPSEPRKYKSRSNAQDGHEAIRPTTIELSPDKVKDSLTPEQYKLYKIIWERFIACQMSDCIHKTTSAEILAGNYIFKASGYRVDFDGFTVLYVESKDTDEESEQELPPLKEGMELRVKTISPNQHFTQPPARYTEASLIKALEEYGIGRPSTYAATISTITSREYVKRESKTLIPTELGEVITKLMKERFPKIVNVKFTAQMESDLDTVEEGKCKWQDLLADFYGDFDKTLKKANEEMKDVKIELEQDKTDITCELCGRQMVVKFGRYGKFIACPGWPECKNIKKFVVKAGVHCPKCGGDVIVKKTKRGRVFYGCENYPECDFVSWYMPSEEKCPNCGAVIYKKAGKKPTLFCQAEGCGFSKPLEEEN